MKNKLFGKTTALVMGSLMIFSGSALAMKSHNQEVTNAEALGEVELLVAQADQLKPEDFEALSQLVVQAKTTIGDVDAQLSGVAESELPGKDALSQVVVDLESVIGDLGLKVDNQALTKGEGVAIAQTIAKLATTVGDIAADLSTTAQSEKGKAVAQTAIEASTTVGDIAIEAESIAKVGKS